MMRTLLLSLALLAVATDAIAGPPAAAPAAGRWRGLVHIPGEDLAAVVDLDLDAAGAWHGSATIPGLNLAGTPLAAISASGQRVAFSIPSALGGARGGAATFAAELKAGATLSGTFSQGGNTAPFSMTRAGPAQVEQPAASTAVAPVLVGTWKGDYQLAGYAHHVTLGFTNHDGAPATVEFLLVGKQPHTLNVDLVTENEGLLRVESRELSVNFEGRMNAASGELEGVVEQGPFEAPIVLRRVPGGAP
jgi:hypothetical protein